MSHTSKVLLGILLLSLSGHALADTTGTGSGETPPILYTPPPVTDSPPPPDDGPGGPPPSGDTTSGDLSYVPADDTVALDVDLQNGIPLEDALAQCPDCPVVQEGGETVMLVGKPEDTLTTLDTSPAPVESLYEEQPSYASVGMDESGEVSYATPYGTPQTLSINASNSRNWGNTRFGAGYTVSATLSASPTTSTGKSRFYSIGQARAVATLFGGTTEILLAKAEGEVLLGSPPAGLAGIYLMGTALWEARGGTISKPQVAWYREFFKATMTFPIVGIPVNLSAAVNGSVSFNTGVQLADGKLGVSESPGADFYAVGTASVGVEGTATAGGQINLSLLKVTVPISGQLYTVACDRIHYDLAVSAQVSTLSGAVSAYVEVKVPWPFSYRVRWDRPIASWTGYTATYPISARSGESIIPVTCGSATSTSSTPTYETM